jgi:stress response protein YsnF
MQEEVVVSKRIVPRERIRVRKNVVTEQREITDTLRSEQVDIDSGAETARQLMASFALSISS